MADWSQLPKDLLHLISSSLEAPFDVLRFRSVCSTWRSSASPRPRRLPNRFPILPNDGISDTTWGFHLSKRTIYRISSPPPPESDTSPQSQSWIIKIEEDQPDRIHLLNPLSGAQFKPLPSNLVKIWDVTKFRIWELGQEYVMNYIDYRPSANSLNEASTLYMEKVVFRQEGNPNLIGSERIRFSILTIHVSGRLAMFRSGEKKWQVVKEMQSPYDDVKLYKGRFFAVDNTGRTVEVGSASDVELVAIAVFGGDKKYLVECCGGLLLVDMYLTMDVDGGQEEGDEEGEVEEEQFMRSLNERIVRFKVYRLVEKEKKWEEMESLGDLMLFLGDNCTFSVSANELEGFEGNCIYITNCMNNGDEDRAGTLQGCGIGVYHLGRGNFESLDVQSDHWKLFWPPPFWVSTTMGVNVEGGVESQFEDLSL